MTAAFRRNAGLAPALPHDRSPVFAAPGMENGAGRPVFPAGATPLLLAVAARAGAMVPMRELGAMPRRMQKALVMALLELVVPTIGIMPAVMSGLVMPEVVPARWRRIVLEPERPRLRLEVPVRRVVVMDDLRTVAQDDAKVERGHQIRVNRAVAVSRSRRRQEGSDAERRGEQERLMHGSSPETCSQADPACDRPFERALSVVFRGRSVGPG